MNRDKNHVDWVRSWVQVLTELQAFVKQHHTTGLVWNNNGIVVISIVILMSCGTRSLIIIAC